jgi:hypothetical protein
MLLSFQPLEKFDQNASQIPPHVGHPATVGFCIKLFRKRFYQKPVSLVKLSF